MKDEQWKRNKISWKVLDISEEIVHMRVVKGDNGAGRWDANTKGEEEI